MYNLDLTYAYYRRRRLWAIFWASCALLLIGYLANAVVRAYRMFTEPTLSIKLSSYEFGALAVERTVKSWTHSLALSKEMEPFYLVQGAPSMADVLQCLADGRRSEPHHIRPARWQLRRPGDGRIEFQVDFSDAATNRLKSDLLKSDLVAEETNRLAHLLVKWTPQLVSPPEEKLHALEKALVTATLSLSAHKDSLMPTLPPNFKQTYDTIQSFRLAATDYRIEEQSTTLGNMLSVALSSATKNLDQEGAARIKQKSTLSLNPGAILDAMSVELRKVGQADPVALVAARRAWMDIAERRVWRSALETQIFDPSSVACSNLLEGALPASNVWSTIDARFQAFTGAWEKAWTRQQVLGGTVPIAEPVVSNVCQTRLRVPNLTITTDVQPGTNRFVFWNVKISWDDSTKSRRQDMETWEADLAALVRDLEQHPRGFMATGVDVIFGEQSHDFSSITLNGILMVRPENSIEGKGDNSP